jgi:hypothetical protein
MSAANGAVRPSGASAPDGAAYGIGTDAARATGQELRALATEGPLQPRGEQLRALASALEGTGDSDTWSCVDLFEAFPQPPDSLVEPAPPADLSDGPTVRWLELVRNLLVFLPIAVTWYGLFEASRLYREVTRTIPAPAESFFNLWLTGFDGRLRFTFDRMALSTLAVLVLLIVISLLVELVRHRAERAVDAERRHAQAEPSPLQRLQLLRRRQATALTDASLHLATVTLASPNRFQAELTKTSRSFGQLVGKVRTSGELAERTLEQLHHLSGSIQPTVELAAEVGRDVARAAESVGMAGDQLRTRIDDAVAASATAIEGLKEATADSSRQLGDRVDESARWIVAAVEKLLGASERLASRTERAYDQALVVLNGQNDRLTSVQESASEAARQVAAATTALDPSMRQLLAGLEHAGTTQLAGIADAVSRAVDALDQLTVQLDRYAASTPQLVDAFGRLEETLNRDREAGGVAS